MNSALEKTMRRSNLQCGTATNLFYEPEGLLLCSCLYPADDKHLRHLLTFQLGYLGTGEITVDVALEGGPGTQITTPSDEPTIVAARLVGAGNAWGSTSRRDALPGTVNLSYVTISSGYVQLKYTVLGQAAMGGSLRGELSATVAGRLPNLSVTTSSGATRRVLQAPRLAPQFGCPAVDDERPRAAAEPLRIHPEPWPATQRIGDAARKPLTGHLSRP
jgi:hypothetical protein